MVRRKKKEETFGKPAWAGVDTHKETNMLALLDGLGRVIGTWEFPTGAAGYAQLEAAIGDASVPVGIEGTGSYGSGLADHLQSCGYAVYEVLCPKKDKRRKGKSDPIDAVAAAESVQAGKGVTRKDMTGAVGDIACMMIARDQIVVQMGSISNCVDAMLVSAPDELRQEFACRTGGARMRKLAAIRREGGRESTLKMLAARWLRSEKEADDLEAAISDLVRQVCPALLGTPCVGAISAARLIVAAGANPERMESEAAFSMLCGTSPIPASSGKTNGRHRLNRGGDRQANRAIHEIARARMSHDPRTALYIEKKMAEGKTKKEAIRCLCRYIAREVFKLMTGPQRPLPDPSLLAVRRKELGLRQVDVMDRIGFNIPTDQQDGERKDAQRGDAVQIRFLPRAGGHAGGRGLPCSLAISSKPPGRRPGRLTNAPSLTSTTSTPTIGTSALFAALSNAASASQTRWISASGHGTTGPSTAKEIVT